MSQKQQQERKKMKKESESMYHAPLSPRALATVSLVVLLLAFTATAVGAIGGGQVDDFEDGTTQGWREGANSPNPPTNVTSGGPAGSDDNYLQNVSSGGAGAGSKMVMFNTLQWAGDHAAAESEVIAAEIKNAGSSELVMHLALDGDGGWFGTSTGVTLPADGKWHAQFFDLRASNLTSLGGTDALATLSNVVHLRLLHNPVPGSSGAPISATMGVDNITAGPIDFGSLGATHGHAWHTLSGIHLGSGVDADVGPDGDVNDGISRDPSDPWPPGTSAVVTATVTGGSGYLVGWIDWNGDGTFENSAPERIVSQAVSSGENVIAITVPNGVGYDAGDPLKARFRLYDADAGDSRPTGLGQGGEVEDYHWTVFRVFLPLVLGSFGPAP